MGKTPSKGSGRKSPTGRSTSGSRRTPATSSPRRTPGPPPPQVMQDLTIYPANTYEGELTPRPFQCNEVPPTPSPVQAQRTPNRRTPARQSLPSSAGAMNLCHTHDHPGSEESASPYISPDDEEELSTPEPFEPLLDRPNPLIPPQSRRPAWESTAMFRGLTGQQLVQPYHNVSSPFVSLSAR